MFFRRDENIVFSLTQCFALCALLTYASSFTLAQQTAPLSDSMLGASGTSNSPEPSNGAPEDSRSVICGPRHFDQCFKDIAHDQAGIWTSPLRIKSRDALWLIPLAASTGVALHYDAEALQELGVDKTRTDVSSTLSDVALYGSIAGTAGIYFLGAATHNDRLTDTGRLGGEAIVNSLLVAEALKLATNRERPNEGNGQGGFWPHGTRSYETDGSFPSAHAVASFALARVIAYEYSSKPIQLGAYTLALAISASRVTAREHFPSDVLVGGSLGYLIGGYVVRHRGGEYVDSGFSFSPVIDLPTRSFGASVELRPDHLHLMRLRNFTSVLHLKRN